MTTVDRLFFAMFEFDQGDPRRIQHLTKVHAYASYIGRQERLDEGTQFILELAALTHDIGIRPATERYGHCTGKMQEEIGPEYAKEMLETLGVEAVAVERVCYLIAHHHTYTDVDGLDYRILLEADFLVNLEEKKADLTTVESAYHQHFATETGRKLCRTMFGF